MKILSLLYSLVAVASFASFSLAAEPKKPVSPHETITAKIGDASLSLSYGRPYTKDPKTGEPRKIWGALVPYGKVWRTGANEATVLTTDKPLMFGNTTIPAGSYSLWTVPEADGSAKLIFNSETGQWGTKHDDKKDFARVDLKKGTTAAPVDQFTMAIDKTGSGGAIRLAWESTEYTAPFSVGK